MIILTLIHYPDNSRDKRIQKIIQIKCIISLIRILLLFLSEALGTCRYIEILAGGYTLFEGVYTNPYTWLLSRGHLGGFSRLGVSAASWACLLDAAGSAEASERSHYSHIYSMPLLATRSRVTTSCRNKRSTILSLVNWELKSSDELEDQLLCKPVNEAGFGTALGDTMLVLYVLS